MTEGIIVTGTVKSWSSKGGAYVAVPANLVGQEVYIIPKGKVGKVTISVNFEPNEGKGHKAK